MIITWYGHACFRLQGNLTDATLLIDPYDSTLGKKIPKMSANILVESTQSPAATNEEFKKRSDELFVIANAGEYEVRGVSIQSIAIDQKDKKEPTHVSVVRIDDMLVVHLGLLGRELTEKELDLLGHVDLCIIPVGGGNVLSPVRAVETINALEPRVVIPMCYASAGLKTDMGPLDAFLKEYGLKSQETLDKYKVHKKDLPQEETTVIVLEAQ
ncbi:MBL fold metallo-hydrolase [Candidatus Uhrbacteria bacterium]|nr:MBL fold metallo-hydrolase [Candidatus Uhrbacteria bacterium]